MYCGFIVFFMIEHFGGRRGGSARRLRFYTFLASGKIDFRKLKKGVWHDRHHDSFAILRFYIFLIGNFRAKIDSVSGLFEYL